MEGGHEAERVPSPPSPAAQRIDDDASIHDRLLWAIHLSGMDDLLLFLSSSSAEQQWSLHVLEIVSLMFRDQVRPCSSRPLRVCFLQCAQLLWKEWGLPEEAGEGCRGCVFCPGPSAVLCVCGSIPRRSEAKRCG